jgi:acetolactate synthase-1/2/3 large subunit
MPGFGAPVTILAGKTGIRQHNRGAVQDLDQVRLMRSLSFLFTGDGSFGLTAMELDTAARHGLPVVVVVVNNGGWGDVRHEQRAMYGREADVGAVLSDLRYDLLAEAVGGHGETVESGDDLEPALRRAVDAGVPAVINVLCEGEVMSELMRNLSALDVM